MRKKKQNVIIYGSLFIAFLLIVYAIYDYYHDKDSSNSAINELKEVLSKKENDEEDKIVYGKEPSKLVSIDKKEVISKYLDDIVNRRIENELLSYDVVSTWGEFEVVGIDYIKSITDDYYAYDVSIKISNINGRITGRKNDKLSKDNYIVVNIEFDLLISESGISVKNIKI